ncbi:MAG: hypothetical protein LAN59_15875 [Acidobacteriia bacterium]|nr:hypothetical protein [Terriglobia bacterium]
MAAIEVMVVAHDPEAQQAFARALGPRGLAPILASTVKEAEAIVSRQFISLVFCFDEVPVVVSRRDDWERRRNALRAGAFGYILYPLAPEEIDRALELWCR